MNCNDPAVLTVVMPTKDRPEFVARALGFLARQGFRGRVLCVDASSEDGFAQTAAAIATVPAVSVIHHRPNAPGNAWREIVEALDGATSRYVQLHHDDDFYFVDEIDRAIAVLDTRTDVVSAQGRFLFVEQNADGAGFSLSTHDRFAYREHAAVERAFACMARFGHLLFAVMRRDDFVGVLAHVYPRLEQGWFDQYAISILIAARGKAEVSDGLFGVRQLHATQHHRQFRGPLAYKHWPMIVAAPDFSATYAVFKDCLLEGIGLDATAEAVAQGIDEGFVSLVERAAGRLPEREPEDVSVFERANRAGTEEHDRLKSVVAAVRSHAGARVP